MTEWLVIIVSLLFSAFFSGTEIAFLKASRLKIELDRKQGIFYAKIYSNWVSNPGRFIGMLLIGNNIGLVVYGIFMAWVMEPKIVSILPDSLNSTSVILIFQTIVSTLLVLVTAEFLPKVLFRINPIGMLKVFAIPTFVLYYIFYPFVVVVSGMASILLNLLFGIKPTKHKPVFGKIDLEQYIEEQSGEHDEENDVANNIQIFQNAMDFAAVKVRECMVPRPEIIAIDVSGSIQDLKEKLLETELSRILVYKNNIDNILGYIHSRELFKNPASLADALFPVQIVPETMSARKLLSMLIHKNQSIAVVVDEFGGTSGLVTLEDIVEEIFGEIEDEFDVEEHLEKQIGDNEYIFSGRLEIDHINEKYDLNIPEADEYETLSGFIIHNHESIPKANEEIVIDKFSFQITHVSNTIIKLVKLRVLDKKNK